MVGHSIANEYFKEVTGEERSFTIERPSDRLRNRLLLEQNLDIEFAGILTNGQDIARIPLPDPFVISLKDAMRIGAENDDSYQAEKEKVFSKALSLDESRHEFETTFAGIIGGSYSGSDSKGEASSSKVDGRTSPSLSKKFKNGLTFAASLGLDIAKLLTGDKSTTLGLSGDTSISIPLLSGAGRAIATESLTQSERNMTYAIYEFERFRQNYAIKVAEGYYAMLEKEQNQIATRENAERLEQNFKKAAMQYEAGRLSQVELDQTRQDLLSNKDALKTSELNLKSQLDSFKRSLGLPVDARVLLDMRELDVVRNELSSRITETNSYGQPIQPKLPWTEDEAIEIAFSNRIDVLLAKYRLEDARRQFKLAKDKLLPELALGLNAGFGHNKKTNADWKDTSSYGAKIDFKPLLDQTAKRNNYKLAAIALDAEERSFATLADTTRQLIRDDFRSIDSAWSSFVIQGEALEVAERRVRSTDIFQQAGKSSTRDVLEAQAALLKARNACVSALVNYRMAGLNLRKDLSLLNITKEGLLLED